MTAAPTQLGKVFLIGGGPGDPGLITLRGRDRLALADLILYDYLVNPAILQHAKPSAEMVCLGRHGRDRIMRQDEVNGRMVEAARAGRMVARLKGGDPAVFGRLAEEIGALQAAGIPFEVVPGLTAGLAVGSYAGIPLTQGDAASAVALVTGQEREGKAASQLDFSALAAFPGTLVFYMGVTTARQWTDALMQSGKSGSTPAAIVRRCSWPDQETIHCRLETVADELAQRRMRPPVLVIVGEVAALAGPNWFAGRPLFGQRVLITRPRHQQEALVQLLGDLGAETLFQPAIEISPPADWEPADMALSRLSEFDWLVFSSANGVQYFLRRLLSNGQDLRALRRVKLAAIGPATAAALAEFHLRADLVPDEFRAEALAAALATHTVGKRVLLIRASRGRETLAEDLRAAGARVGQVVVYASRDVEQADPEISAALSAGKIDWITVTSSAIARSLAKLFGDALRNAKLASISPITSGVLRELGFEPAVEATDYTMSGLVEAIRAAVD